jgi:putative alpha-1,2-mannosidase
LFCPNTPVGLQSWNDHKEGDSLQWSLFVPHDVEGLIALHGRTNASETHSNRAFYDQLEYFFQHHVSVNEKIGHVLPNPYYWAGNEHDAFAVWMFSFGKLGQSSVRPDKDVQAAAEVAVQVGGFCARTQYWSRRLTHMHFSALPNGVPGNEDYGAMATWLLFASLGIYPQAGTSNFIIGSPRVVSATIKLDGHVGGAANLEPTRFVRIQTYNNSEVNVYVGRLLVNGEVHTSPMIDRSVLVQEGGCKLEFFMSSAPISGLCL